MNTIGSINYDFTHWPLAVIMAQLFKPEIQKMTGQADETARQERIISGREEANLKLKRVEAVKETSPLIGLGYDRERARQAYERRKRKGKLEKGRNIDIPRLLWYEILLSFLGGWALGLYLGFSFIESTLLALFGSSLGIYFHELYHFYKARGMILKRNLKINLLYGVGRFHQELMKALKKEATNSYLWININKIGVRVVYPYGILSDEENLKVRQAGSRANMRVFISFAILGILFHLAFTVIAFSSFIQGGFATFREGMRNK